jgi:hypothetical protein
MAMRWKGVSTRHKAGGRRSPAFLSALAAGQRGSTGVAGMEPSSSAVKILLTPRRYPVTSERKSNGGGVNLSAGRVTGGKHAMLPS